MYPLHCQNFTVKRLKYNIALFLTDEHENIFSHLIHTHTHTTSESRYLVYNSDIFSWSDGRLQAGAEDRDVEEREQ